MLSIGESIRKIKSAIKHFLIGATVYDIIRDLEEKRLWAEYIFMLVVFGDMFGYSVSSYYRLKLLPFWVPRLEAWKRDLLKERDITDKLG